MSTLISIEEDFMSTKITVHKKMMLPKGSVIRVIGKGGMIDNDVITKKDIFFDTDDGQFLSLEYENWVRYQYTEEVIYWGYTVSSIDFKLEDMVEVV
jgi:hypothetical protein